MTSECREYVGKRPSVSPQRWERVRVRHKSTDFLEWRYKEKNRNHRKPKVESAIATQFRLLTKQWIRGTERFSNLSKIVMHPAYLQIIAMGPEVIPEILKRLTKGPDHWFVALHALTQGEDPAAGLSTMQAAADAWIKWGRENGHLDR